MSQDFSILDEKIEVMHLLIDINSSKAKKKIQNHIAEKEFFQKFCFVFLVTVLPCSLFSK